MAGVALAKWILRKLRNVIIMIFGIGPGFCNPHTDRSETQLLRIIAGAFVLITGRTVHYPSESKTELLRVIAGALKRTA